MFFLNTLLYPFRISLQLQKRIAGAISDLPRDLVSCILKMSPVAILHLMPPPPYLYLSSLTFHTWPERCSRLKRVLVKWYLVAPIANVILNLLDVSVPEHSCLCHPQHH